MTYYLIIEHPACTEKDIHDLKYSTIEEVKINFEQATERRIKKILFENDNPLEGIIAETIIAVQHGYDDLKHVLPGYYW